MIHLARVNLVNVNSSSLLRVRRQYLDHCCMGPFLVHLLGDSQRRLILAIDLGSICTILQKKLQHLNVILLDCTVQRSNFAELLPHKVIESLKPIGFKPRTDLHLFLDFLHLLTAGFLFALLFELSFLLLLLPLQRQLLFAFSSLTFLLLSLLGLLLELKPPALCLTAPKFGLLTLLFFLDPPFHLFPFLFLATEFFLLRFPFPTLPSFFFFFLTHHAVLSSSIFNDVWWCCVFFAKRVERSSINLHRTMVLLTPIATRTTTPGGALCFTAVHRGRLLLTHDLSGKELKPLGCKDNYVFE